MRKRLLGTNNKVWNNLARLKVEYDFFRNKTVDLQFQMEGNVPLAYTWQNMLKKYRHKIAELRKEALDRESACQRTEKAMKELEKRSADEGEQHTNTVKAMRLIIARQEDYCRAEGRRITLFGKRFRDLINHLEQFTDPTDRCLTAAWSAFQLVRVD